MTQILIALFGLTAMFCAMGNNARLRRYAPIIGLCGQPAWAWFAWQTQAWGLAVICVAYSLVYIQGIRVQWGKA